MPDSFTLPAFAKINLFLHIHGKRADGYHELCTVFQTISLHDSLTFSPTGDDQVRLTCSDVSLPTDENNVIIRAASLLKKEFNVTKGANIHLDKRIPSPGGLGGGSSDAAITLIGLVKLWRLNIDVTALKPIAEKLGSDVTFFLYGGTAIGTGRGTDVTSTVDYNDGKMLIVTPRVNVATADAYSLLTLPSLTIDDSNRILKICHNEAERLLNEQSELRNDFEDVVFQLNPELAQVKDSLLKLNAVNVLMSGSGASFFASFADGPARQNAMEQLKRETDWRVFAVETVSRARYLESLSVCSGVLLQ